MITTEISVYADVVFLINFAMDFFVIAAAGRLLKLPRRQFRVPLGAFAAALAGCAFTFITIPRGGLVPLAGLLVLCGGLAAAYSPIRIRAFGKLVAAAYGIAFGVGGAMTALFTMTNLPYIAGLTIQRFSVWALFGGTVVSYALLKLARRVLRTHELQKCTYYHVTVSIGSASASFQGLVDTGCALIDPITQAPVIIAEFGELCSCLPEPVKQLFRESREDNLNDLLDSFRRGGLSSRMRMIPFASIGAPNGMLVGFRPDSVVLTRDGQRFVSQNTVIGICRSRLSDGAYSALLNPALIV